MMDVSARRFDAASLRTFVARIFETVGMPVADASIVAELMVSADLGGAEAHGIFRLPQYVRRICAGGINLHPNIRIARERDGMALIDGAVDTLVPSAPISVVFTFSSCHLPSPAKRPDSATRIAVNRKSRSNS